MITVKLLGGAKKAIGKSEVKIDKPSASVSEILQFLQGISLEPRLLEPLNLIIAINGVDSAVLSKQKTVAKSGDTVTIVTVVHGGADRRHNYDNIKGFYVSIIGIITIMNDPETLVDNLRAIEQDLSIQAVRASAVYGSAARQARYHAHAQTFRHHRSNRCQLFHWCVRRSVHSGAVKQTLNVRFASAA